MANGTDSDEYVVLSRVRPGLKREFAFAMSSQSAYSGSVGRTRARRAMNALEHSSSKKMKIDETKERECEGDKSAAQENVGTDAEANPVYRKEEDKTDVVVVSSDYETKNSSVELVEQMRSGSGDELVNNEATCNQIDSEESGGNVSLKQNPRLGSKQKGKAGGKNGEVEGSSSMINSKLELKMSKKIGLKKLPTKLKELLETGLLEGLPVKYLRGLKVRDQSETGLQGIIKGSGILCFCDDCNGAQVVTPNQFEMHAGSANKRPPEYVYLDNGNTLRDVLNACKNVPLEELETAVQVATGLARRQPTFCLKCKGNGKAMLLCDSCLTLKECQPSDKCDSSPVSASAPNSSARVAHYSSTRSKSHGRLTRKDLRMHKLVFEGDVLPNGTELSYVAGGEKLLLGYKQGCGIVCSCCKTEVSPSLFEAHAGWASRRKPYLHIYTSNGVSLHELSLRLATEKKFSTDENDDLCSICHDGGDLFLCDSCPRAFHPGLKCVSKTVKQVFKLLKSLNTDCLSLTEVPPGAWYCKICQSMIEKEKSVERNPNALAAGRVAGIDPIQQITNRCIRIVSTPESEPVCVLCSDRDFTKTFGPLAVIICDQCEKEYHVNCMKEHGIDDLKALPDSTWFCCTDCDNMYSTLQELVNGGEKMLSSCSLETITKKLERRGVENQDIRWRLLSGRIDSEESKVLLSKAVDIFHDQFDPIANSSTGRLDLIPQMVFGKEVKKIEKNFGGMYCAILTANSRVVSAGLVRIFGKEVAELPLVATCADSQGQGYFQSLFSYIEELLQSLDVKTLVLPAADEAESIWTKKFGFKKMTQDELKQYKMFHQMMIFEGTSMLHKPVTRS